MDEHLKARLIGATILVVIAVLLIPALLTGRKTAAPVAEAGSQGHGTRIYTIDLSGAGSAASAARPAEARSPRAALPQPETPPPAATDTVPATGSPIAAAAESHSPAPAPAQGAAAGSGAKTPVATAAPAREPAVARTPQSASPKAEPPPPAAAAAVPKGGWCVQVGAFGAATTANKMVSDLKAAGFKAYLSSMTKSGKTLHRVRVGPDADRSDAERLAAKLKGRGLPATVVAND